MKRLLAKLKAETSPKQLSWLLWALRFAACVFLLRVVQIAWPSMWLSLIIIVALAGAAIYLTKLVASIPKHRAHVAPFTIIFIGGFLNQVARAANNGFMPAVGVGVVKGTYCPLDGANFAYLGDWIFGFISPGDIILIVAFFGIVATMLRNQRRQAKEVQ